MVAGIVFTRQLRTNIRSKRRYAKSRIVFENTRNNTQKKKTVKQWRQERFVKKSPHSIIV